MPRSARRRMLHPRYAYAVCQPLQGYSLAQELEFWVAGRGFAQAVVFHFFAARVSAHGRMDERQASIPKGSEMSML